MATNKRWRETKVVFKWIGIKPCIDCWLVEEKQKLYLNNTGGSVVKYTSSLKRNKSCI